MIKVKFCEKVEDCINLIPFGRVTTYGEIAKVLGRPMCSGLVKKVINSGKIKNYAVHRVVDRQGKLSKSFIGGINKQKELLVLEGVEVKNKRVDLQKYGFYFW